MVKRNFLLILQARQTSTRFPNKVMQKVLGIPLIIFLLKRLQKCKKVDQIVVAIPKNQNNKKLKDLLKNKIINILKDLKNVLKRFYLCAKKFRGSNIIRITSDCPLADPKIIDKFIEIFKKNVDYLSNGKPQLILMVLM